MGNQSTRPTLVGGNPWLEKIQNSNQRTTTTATPSPYQQPLTVRSSVPASVPYTQQPLVSPRNAGSIQRRQQTYSPQTTTSQNHHTYFDLLNHPLTKKQTEQRLNSRDITTSISWDDIDLSKDIPAGWVLSEEQPFMRPEKGNLFLPIIYNVATGAQALFIFQSSAKNQYGEWQPNLPQISNLTNDKQRQVQKWLATEMKQKNISTPFYFTPNVLKDLAVAVKGSNAVIWSADKNNPNGRQNFTRHFSNLINSIEQIISGTQENIINHSDTFTSENAWKYANWVHQDSENYAKNFSLALYGKGTLIFPEESNSRIEKLKQDRRFYEDGYLMYQEGMNLNPYLVPQGFMAIWNDHVYHATPEPQGKRLALLLTQKY